MQTVKFNNSYSSKTILNTASKTAFEYLDNPEKLSAHMGKSSLMMAGSKMDMILDEKQGREVGSVIKMNGRMMGLEIFLQEKIIERKPFETKIWETFGEQKLVILDQYRMSFILKEKGQQTELTVVINYSLPQRGLFKILGNIFAGFYAKWCVDSMLADAQKAFSYGS